MTSYVTTIIVAVFASSGFWGLVNLLVSKKVEKESIERKALQALLRNELLTMYKEFKDADYIDFDDKANFENCYNIYHNLGQNGVMTNIYNEVMKKEVK